MNQFEKQLSDSSKRLASMQMADIAPVAKPNVRTPIAAAWYTTPAAAVAGLLVGLFLQFHSPEYMEKPELTMVHDTIIEYRYDTIGIVPDNPIQLAQSKPQNSENQHKNSITPAVQNLCHSETYVGKNITEDGIDYSKLISCFY